MARRGEGGQEGGELVSRGRGRGEQGEERGGRGAGGRGEKGGEGRGDRSGGNGTGRTWRRSRRRSRSGGSSCCDGGSFCDHCWSGIGGDGWVGDWLESGAIAAGAAIGGAPAGRECPLRCFTQRLRRLLGRQRALGCGGRGHDWLSRGSGGADLSLAGCSRRAVRGDGGSGNWFGCVGEQAGAATGGGGIDDLLTPPLPRPRGGDGFG